MPDIAFLLVAASGGGAERAMIGVANRFAHAGLAVDMVLIRRDGPFLGEIDPKVRIIDLGAGNIRRALFPLNRYVRRERPPLLVSALFGTDPVALAGKALFRWKTQVHISVQNAPSAGAGVARDRLTRHWPRIMRLLYPQAASLNGISDGVAREVERIMAMPAGSVPVINNPVDIATVRARAAEMPDHPWLSDRTVPVLLGVGRLVPQKDFPTLLRAFARLRRSRVARLLILGEGPERAMLTALAAELGIADDVAIPGFSANPFAAMAAAEVFVLSSAWEGFANVVAEALACGTKVVSTDCPSGPAEILEGGRLGSLVPVGDVDALATALAAAIDAGTDHDALTTRASAFSLDRIADRYLQLFRERGLLA